MCEIVAIVEGETEQAFVRDQLAAHLGYRGTAIWAVLPGKNRRRGGVKRWESARSDILRTLKERRYCTTMFDYYAMPRDWPGREGAVRLPWHRRASRVEEEILADIAAEVGDSFNPAQFIPYVQLHEFEALLFANTVELAARATAISSRPEAELRRQFDQILEAAEHPEAIDDGRDTCPSRRIAGIVAGFRKRIHSPQITERIGMGVLTDRCTHFGEWVRRLEAIGEA